MCVNAEDSSVVKKRSRTNPANSSALARYCAVQYERPCVLLIYELEKAGKQAEAVASGNVTATSTDNARCM
jgi:hypothetical protein